MLIALFFRTTAVQAFSIPTGSATPTMLTGDTVLVSKFAYGYSRYSLPWAPAFLHGRLFGRDPKRGDYVVFANPKDGVITTKRIVGLPGDRIQVTAGILIINGRPAIRTPDGTFLERDWDEAAGGVTESLRYRYNETIPDGMTHAILGAPVHTPRILARWTTRGPTWCRQAISSAWATAATIQKTAAFSIASATSPPKT